MRLALESDIAKRLEQEATYTEAVQLEANSQTFIGLFNQQTALKAAGAIIFLHGMGGHADWPYIISPLRQSLPEHGWSTLSIQLPLLSMATPIEDYGQTLDTAAARIEAAVRYLRSKKFLNIVVVAHSFGAANALHYLTDGQRPKIIALVAIGLQEYAFLKPTIDTLALIENARIPLLDIYGERDYQRVIKQAPDRRLAANKGNNDKYSQIEVAGADHYFLKMEDALAKRIRSWLSKAAPGVSIMVNENFDGNEQQEIEEKTP
ncbi:MAG: alpha/beta fold hydrolase [Pseudomonadota bacterium]